MFKSFCISVRLKNVYRVNSIIYSLKHKGANLKVAIVKKVYVLHLYKAFLAVYKFILKTFKIDIKW